MNNDQDKQTDKIFYVQGFGEVGAANLEYGVVAITSGRDWHDIEVGECCTVRTRDGLERIRRTK